MAFKSLSKQPGDMIQSADWNAMNDEIERLGTAKVNRTGDTLSVQGLTLDPVTAPLEGSGWCPLTESGSVHGCQQKLGCPQESLGRD